MSKCVDLLDLRPESDVAALVQEICSREPLVTPRKAEQLAALIRSEFELAAAGVSLECRPSPSLSLRQSCKASWESLRRSSSNCSRYCGHTSCP